MAGCTAPVRGHWKPSARAKCPVCGGAASGSSVGSSLGVSAQTNVPPPTAAKGQLPNAAEIGNGQEQVEALVQLGLSKTKSEELLDILNTAAWEVIESVEERKRSSHLLCELFNNAAKFLEENAPDSLAQQAIKAIVGNALDHAGGVLAVDPCKTIVVKSVGVFTEKLTDLLSVPDIEKIVLALKLLAMLVCPSADSNPCGASAEASRDLSKTFTGNALIDAHRKQIGQR